MFSRALKKAKKLIHTHIFMELVHMPWWKRLFTHTHLYFCANDNFMDPKIFLGSDIFQRLHMMGPPPKGFVNGFVHPCWWGATVPEPMCSKWVVYSPPISSMCCKTVETMWWTVIMSLAPWLCASMSKSMCQELGATLWLCVSKHYMFEGEC